MSQVQSNALSPLDGRYANKMGGLPAIFSEAGLMNYRAQVEVRYLLALLSTNLPGMPTLSENEYAAIEWFANTFDEEDAESIKLHEKTTNHDVKAVEYWLKDMFAGKDLGHLNTFIHFALTSEDVNNIAHALQMKAGRDVLLETICEIISTVRDLAHKWADVPMLSRTHGQPASPTTVGKELANVVVRLSNACDTLGSAYIYAKLNGAVGNYNAHVATFPNFNWEVFSHQLIEGPRPTGFGLTFQQYTTQIEPHDYMAEIFDAIARLNTILIDFARDAWGYIALGYFKQKLKDGEVGSSTMPHKVNPIDFENAEGNLGLANAILRHMAEKLPISRFQRDLTDSTVLRNMGVAFGYSLLAYTSLQKGLSKLELNESKIQEELDDAWEVMAEPIQTVMRRYGIQGAYEALKEVTRGKSVTYEAMRKLIEDLQIPEEERVRLWAMTPASYIGKAAELARRC